MKISKLIILIFPFLLFSIIVDSHAQIHDDENEVVIPFGAFSPLCAKKNTCYVPNNIIIEQGDSIIWINDDYAPHTVTSGNLWSGKDGRFESEILNHNDTFSFTFSGYQSGIYPYYCMMHPWMKGIVSIDGQIDFIRN